MVEAKRCDNWDIASSVLTMIYNANRGEKQKALGVEDFHPYRQKPEPKLIDKLRSLIPHE